MAPFFQRHAEERGGFGILGIAREHGPEAIRGGDEFARAQLVVADIEVVIRIGVVALQGFLVAGDRRGELAALGLSRAQVVEDLVERQRCGDFLKGPLGSRKLAGVEPAEA